MRLTKILQRIEGRIKTLVLMYETLTSDIYHPVFGLKNSHVSELLYRLKHLQTQLMVYQARIRKCIQEHDSLTLYYMSFEIQDKSDIMYRSQILLDIQDSLWYLHYFKLENNEILLDLATEYPD